MTASTSTSCSNCQQAVKPGWNLCPHCGQYNPARLRSQIRCKTCGRQAAEMLHTCPHCGAYLEPSSIFSMIEPWLLLQLILGTVILVGLGFVVVQLLSDSTSPLGFLLSSAVPTTTITPTSSATYTVTPSPNPTTTPTSTATKTARPPTPTPTITLTPTKMPFGVPTTTNTPTPTATPTPRFSKPILLGPEDEKLFGRADELILRWKDMGTLTPNEWYAVRLTWTQDGQTSFGGHNLKDNFWIVPANLYWGLADEFTGRKYEWFVFIEEITVDDNGQEIGRPVSKVSDRFAFLWQQ